MLFWRSHKSDPHSPSRLSTTGEQVPGEYESAAIPPLLPAPVRAARESRNSRKVLEEAYASAAQLLLEFRATKMAKLQPDVLQSLKGLAELSRLAVAAVGPSSQ